MLADGILYDTQLIGHIRRLESPDVTNEEHDLIGLPLEIGEITNRADFLDLLTGCYLTDGRGRRTQKEFFSEYPQRKTIISELRSIDRAVFGRRRKLILAEFRKQTRTFDGEFTPEWHTHTSPADAYRPWQKIHRYVGNYYSGQIDHHPIGTYYILHAAEDDVELVPTLFARTNNPQSKSLAPLVDTTHYQSLYNLAHRRENEDRKEVLMDEWRNHSKEMLQHAVSFRNGSIILCSDLTLHANNSLFQPRPGKKPRIFAIAQFV